MKQHDLGNWRVALEVERGTAVVTIVSLIVVLVIGMAAGPWARRLGRSYRENRRQTLDQKDSNDF